jgi:hypothetical protein
MTLLLSGTNGLSDVDGTAATPAIRGTDANTGMFFPAADTIAFAEGGVEAMRLDSNGNVGIGTSLPATKFVVSAGRTTLSANNENFALQLNNGTTPNGPFLGSSGLDTLVVSTSGGTEQMRIDASGNLLLGTTVFSTNAVGIRFANSATVPFISVGVSAASNNYLLYNTTAAAFRFFVSDAGQINATSTSIAAISDASLKENVRDLDTGLTQVMALKPRRFDWKEDTKIGLKNVAGFIAQEVEQILPDLVYDYQYNADETKKSLKMGDILPTLVKAIQEQQAMIEQLKADVAALKGTV